MRLGDINMNITTCFHLEKVSILAHFDRNPHNSIDGPGDPRFSDDDDLTPSIADERSTHERRPIPYNNINGTIAT